jgi:hypothetical protein
MNEADPESSAYSTCINVCREAKMFRIFYGGVTQSQERRTSKEEQMNDNIHASGR